MKVTKFLGMSMWIEVTVGQPHFADRIEFFRIFGGHRGQWKGAVIRRRSGWWEVI